MQTTTTTNNNRCHVETARDVAHVEYDVINYYTQTNVNPNLCPNLDALHQQRCSRINNNNNNNNSSSNSSNTNTLLDVVVNARAAREDSTATPTQQQHQHTSSNSSSSSPTMRNGFGNRLRSIGKGTSNASSGANSSSTPTLGVNMRVTGQCSQGGRKYMEDQFSVAYQESPLTHELEYAFFGIYDGHGGTEAALFAKEHLMLEIVKQKLFWSDNDEDVLRAIREGYIGTHFAMWREQDKWPRTANGHLSTAGTTATVAFMRREKIYIGHVGDSGIVLGYQNPNERRWRAKQLTTDHKPESVAEKSRIQRAGGQVAIKSGVPRVVWNRPRDPMHRGPIRRRTIVDDIPFLAVARSLGDLWSYNSRYKEFVVSPDPDVKVVKIDPNTFRCLIFGTDGLWNVVSPQEAVDSVREKHFIGECLHEQDVMNPSKALVERALKTWASKKMRADNTSVVTVILTPAAAATTSTSATSATATATTTATATENIDLLVDTENNYPSELDELVEDEHDELNMELCAANIEEQEYLHDTPYSALAKRHLPPEPYRNFDYYIEEQQLQLLEEAEEQEQEEEEEEHEHDDDDDDEEDEEEETEGGVVEVEEEQLMQQQNANWRKSLQQSIANWHQTSMMREIDAMLQVAHDEEETTMTTTTTTVAASASAEAEAEAETELYCGNSNSCELEHNYNSCYVSSASVNGSTEEYSFAESYNTLLNEQQQQQQQHQQQQSQQQSQQQQLQLQHQQQQHQQQPEKEQQQEQLLNSMQEILQEQQRYQQQEGYSLTQLETRREQQQQHQHQHHHNQVDNSNRWQQEQQQQQQQSTATYVEQPVELLALNALLQQERDEEQQVALEREQKQQQQQLLLVEASSSSCSSNSSASCSPSSCTVETQFAYATASWNASNVATLQDNEVSSTLPATPTPMSTSNSSSAEEAQPMESQQDQQQQQHQQQQQQMTSSHPSRIRRQMRRYRNVPNENHQHMQTRRRQMFKHSSKSKAYSAAAAFVAAYSSSNNNSSSSAEVLPSSNSSSSSNNVKSDISSSKNNSSNSSNNSSSSNRKRRRSVVNSGNGSSSSSAVMMTRRSHSLSLATGSGVSKRQLRSSICQLGNLDMTKRTLRTRNVTPAANSGSSSNNNNNNSNSGSNINASKSAHTFNKPATPAAMPATGATSTGATAKTAAAAAATSVVVRRLRQSNEEREQRRSLRRSTLSASGSNANISSSSISSSPLGKPTRLQSCSGGIAARPPPAPKKLNAVVPTLAIGTRAYTAALAAAADLSKRWSLRSSSANANAMATLVTAISCYSSSARSRTAPTTTRRR
ncbi:GH24877 [Drosophila grimshawi]|uniref:GH24877 n=1 Tax=Drosophila grimshawi TaxID=7222 RepID=B4JNS8_DROGR|nr:GH24877 [Drosophila grimshawi]